MDLGMNRPNTYFSYLLRAVVATNVLVFFGVLSPVRESASHGLYGWLIYSSMGALVLALLSIFTKADTSRRTGKITDALFALVALVLLVFLSISSAPAL